MKPTLTVLLGALCCAMADSGVAQTLDNVSRGARAGDTIVVTDVSGHTTKAKLLAVTPDSIRLLTASPRDIPVSQISRVERLGDGVGDGFRIGAIAGAVVGTLGMAREGDLPYSVLKVPTGMIEFALLGLVLDWMHVERTTLYQAPPRKTTVGFLPIVEKERRGVALSLTY